ncbi:hypothetical protein FNV43_RR17654 [Rhamnella rubrinervis]|uniref:Uncharacterized protein n=1 Tax=Rhamnella rubrinervis TaxID=2594499 RepID=A0A8K0GS43_9ROSA|nr:hypothetical protein FNV43_RR17654 [Rhamnella rubrinervis]
MACITRSDVFIIAKIARLDSDKKQPVVRQDGEADLLFGLLYSSTCKMYIVKNESHPTAMELQQTYMKGFARSQYQKYYGPPVLVIPLNPNPSLPSLIETITNEGTGASHPPSDQIWDLKLQSGYFIELIKM